MNTDPHVNAYRQQLIDALRRQTSQAQDEAPETIQIMVNHVSIGLLQAFIFISPFIRSGRDRSGDRRDERRPRRNRGLSKGGR